MACVALYQKVAEYIYKQITQGYLKINQVLPSEIDLANRLQVSQGTVRRELDTLVNQGILYRRQGVGTFVSDKNSDWGDYALRDMNMLVDRHIIPHQEIISMTLSHADEYTANQLKIHLSAQVWHIVSLWRVGVVLVAIDNIFLPQQRLPTFGKIYLNRTASLVNHLHLHVGINVRLHEALIGLSRLNTTQAKLLKQAPDTPALNIRYLSYDTNKKEPIILCMRILPESAFFLYK